MPDIKEFSEKVLIKRMIIITTKITLTIISRSYKPLIAFVRFKYNFIVE